MHTESFHHQLHNWCNCNPSRIISEYLLVLSVVSYQLHHQCNDMPEGHIDSKKSQLAKIGISRQGKLLDPEAINEQFGDILHVLAELV